MTVDKQRMLDNQLPSFLNEIDVKIRSSEYLYAIKDSQMAFTNPVTYNV